ncbi:hypothetical protein PAXINDRAFT_97773 [Paxillus involutus ATCC 200175]|nr:hypothetical protein PAXINDRAFT_97773 [Paxillus involutus ATCC 200175]
MSQIKSLTGQSALAFLSAYDPQDAHNLGVHIPLKSKRDSSYAAFAESDLIDDQHATLTVKTTKTNPFEQEIIIKVANGFTFTHKGAFQYGTPVKYPIPNTGVPAEGTIYIRGDGPTPGPAGFNCQQYPSYTSDGTDKFKNGRVSIDIWNTQEITGVFKTNLDNFAYGSNTKDLGEWTKDA